MAVQTKASGMTNHDSRGFALIGILVVIVVIAVLASLVARNVFKPVGGSVLYGSVLKGPHFLVAALQ